MKSQLRPVVFRSSHCSMRIPIHPIRIYMWTQNSVDNNHFSGTFNIYTLFLRTVRIATDTKLSHFLSISTVFESIQISSLCFCHLTNRKHGKPPPLSITDYWQFVIFINTRFRNVSLFPIQYTVADNYIRIETELKYRTIHVVWSLSSESQ